MISMRLRRCVPFLGAVLAILLPFAAHGAAPKKEAPPVQQSVRFVISTPKPASHYTLPLTLDVYTAMSRAEHSGFCVRNAAGENLPFALTRPAVPDTRKERVLPAMDLAWFPMPVEAGGSVDGPLGVTIAPDGSLRMAPGSRPASPKRPGEVISLLPLWAGQDMADVRGTRLTLTIDIAEPEYRGGLRLLESDDLISTRSVGGGKLLYLRNAENALVSNRVEVPGVRGKYLLLYWDDTPPTLTGIRAELVLEEKTGVPAPEFPVDAEAARQRSADPASRQWLIDLPGKKEKDGSIVFQLNAQPPVDFVQLTLPRSTPLVPGTLLSAGRPGEFRRSVLLRKEFFRFPAENGTEKRNPPVEVPLNRAAEWVFTPESTNFASEDTPRLSVSWEPDLLTFVPGGDGPYVLLTDCSGTEHRDIAGLYPGGMARTAEPAGLDAGTPIEPEPTPVPPPDNRRLILWGVLALGVLLLGFMAYKLARGSRAE